MAEPIVKSDAARTAGGEETAAPLALQLLGTWDARVHGRPMPPLRSRKEQWLLALLVLQNGRAVERDWLGGLLWRDSSTAQGLYNLRRNLTDLRDALSPEAGRLQAPTPRTLRLDLAGAEVDVLRFDAAIAAGDGPSLERAVHLYRGPLLIECYEEWIAPERTAREQAYLGALETLSREARAREEREAEGRYLRRALAVDPLHEGAQQALMEALAAQGDLSAALRVYREYYQLLHREASTAPGPEITALFEQLRAQARSRERRLSPPLSGARRAAQGGPAPLDRGPEGGPEDSTRRISSRLPHLVSSFVGRDQEVREIAARLTAGRLVTLTGPGGVGKTRLAIQVAADLVEEYGDGVWLVELAALSDPGLVPQTVAAALGVREEPNRPLTATLADALRARSLLLVLDNCEHLLPACAQLAETLLQRCANLRLVATSREGLRLAGETTYRVPPLSLPDLQRLPPVATLTQFGAAQLFVERAMAGLPSFTLNDQNAASVARVCHQLDGIPLAIELAAARVKALPVETIAERLKDHFRLLTGGSRTTLPRHQTLQALIDWSYALLAAPERMLLRRLSVFAGGWTLEAAETVACGAARVPTQWVDGCAGEEIEAWEVVDLLTSLVEKSLVGYEEQGGEGRYRLLETVRQYARDRLLEAGEVEAVRGRHRDWFLALVEQAEPELRGPQQMAWLERLEREHANLRAALAWTGAQGQGAVGLRLGGALGRFWEVRGYVGEGREHLAELLALPGAEARTAARAWALLGAGRLARQQGDFGAARGLSEESLALFRELGNKQGIAWSITSLGFVARDQGDFGAARALLEESLALFRELGNKRWIVASLGNLGWVAQAQGDDEKTRALYEEALQLAREVDDKTSLIHLLGSMGHAARQQGDYARARTLYQESLALRQEVRNTHAIAQSLEDFAGLAGRQQQWERAARLLGSAEAVCADLGTALPVALAAEYWRTVSGARSALGEAAFTGAWAAGRAMSLDEAVRVALEEDEIPTTGRQGSSGSPGVTGLTWRRKSKGTIAYPESGGAKDV